MAPTMSLFAMRMQRCTRCASRRGTLCRVRSDAASVALGDGDYETVRGEEEERRRRRKVIMTSVQGMKRKARKATWKRSGGGARKDRTGQDGEENERSSLSYEDDGATTSMSAPQLSVRMYEEEGMLELGMDGALLRVARNGQLTLFRRWLENGVVQLTEVTKARVQLPNRPPPSTTTSFRESYNDDNDGGRGEKVSAGFSMTQEASAVAAGGGGLGGAVTITWPARGVLRVLPVGMNRLCDEDDWLGSLTGGFMLQFTALYGTTSEATVDMSSSGSWYGGGHLMRQHWPLNEGCWEVGPFYPFDNGPNGVNTLLHPHWVTTTGLLVVANPDTPYLHVGMNAPRRRKAGGGRN